MKDAFEIFDEYLEKLGPLIDQSRFEACSYTCHHLAVYSTMSDYRDGLLVSETLEGIFVQLGHVFYAYDVLDEEKNQILQDVKSAIAEIGTSYKNDDKNRAYNALSNARNAATRFQIKCWNAFPRRPRMSKRRELQD